MAVLYLALGTNLGNREANLAEAMSRLDSALGGHVAISPTLNTIACGFEGPDFLNCIAVFESEKSPETILGICKEIETRMGRTDTEEYDGDGRRIYHDRIIDIDILFYGNGRVEKPELTIPHPQVQTRSYIRVLLSLLPAGYSKTE